MLQVSSVEFIPGTKEERLPNFDDSFPCISTCCGLYRFDGAPWHWHKAAELFYIQSGCLEYVTPSARHVFHAGSGGFVNFNVPHMTIRRDCAPEDQQLIHLFDPVLIAGNPGSRIEEKYVLPLTGASQTELIPLDPDDPYHAEILELIRRSFQFTPQQPGYELQLRSALSEIWLRILEIAAPQLGQKNRSSRISDQIKLIMIYIRDHYSEHIPVSALAKAAFISERACYTLFRDYLHTTPMEYITSYRLHIAKQMLTQTRQPVTVISAACGLGSSSYFASKFRQTTGMTPLEYRKRNRPAPES